MAGSLESEKVGTVYPRTRGWTEGLEWNSNTSSAGGNLLAPGRSGCFYSGGDQPHACF
jgi:hypothetical protein